ncbi:MAG: LysR family transcriptional regulator [Mobilitalea sp.]
MNLLRLRYFIEAASCENFTEAAKRLYITQPNLSKQIGIMEEELGFSLFHRINHSVFLTKAGRYLYDQLKDIPDRTDIAIKQAKSLNRGEKGSISVGILEGQDVNLLLSDRFQTLNEVYPELSITMERDSFSRLRKGLDTYQYDFIITLSFELRNMIGLQYETLINQKGAIAISRKNPKSNLVNPSLSDYKDENFVSISESESQGGYDMLFEQCKNMNFVPHIVRQTSSLESLLLCVETGIGIAVLDRNTRLEKNSDIRMIPLPDSASADTIAVLREDNKNPILYEVLKILKG